MLEADEIRRPLDAASVPLRAMILLGVNADFGNRDVATLPLSAFDLDARRVNYPPRKPVYRAAVPARP
jgi:hypothetical protein